MTPLRQSCLIALTLLALAPLLRAQPTDPSSHTYDVTDLILPDFFPPPQNPQTPAAEQLAKAMQSQVHDKAAAALLLRIQNALDAGPWNALNTLQLHDHQLIASADAPGHRRIAEVLAALRKDKPTILIESQFVTIAPAALQKLNLPAARQTMLLDDTAAARLIQSLQQTPDATILAAPRITLFSGQSAYIQIVNESAYVSGYSIHLDKDQKPQFKPETSTVQQGLLLAASATATSDRRHIVLTLHPSLTELKGMTPSRFKDSPPGQDLIIQTPILDILETRTTLSIPDGLSLLLALTPSPTTQPAAPPCATHVLIKAQLLPPTP